MPFTPGTSGNKNGRPRGSSNVATANIKKVLQEIFDDNIEQIKQDIKDIELPEKRVKLFLELLQYIAPKMKMTEIEQYNHDDHNHIKVTVEEAEIFRKAFDKAY